MTSTRPLRLYRALVSAALLCIVRPTTAGQQWQLVDPGIPLAADATYLIHVAATGTTYLRIEDQYMVPQWWTLQGTTWARQLEETYPEPMYKASIAYDPVRNVVVRFGGSDKNLNIIAETWEHDGTSWVQRTDVGAPPGRIRAAMAYDSYRNVMVLFGGYGFDDVERNDTWEYDGVQWQQRTFSINPPGRFDAAMAFDANRRKMVLAFGRTLSAGGMSDTWEYNGTKWTKPHASSLPAPRFEAAAAYDPIRQAVYVFGGEASGQTLSWVSSEWQVVSTSTHPSGRYAPSLVFDAIRAKLVLFGGDQGAYTLGDTWEFDGANWSETPTATSEATRGYAGVAFDVASQRPVLYGGYRCCNNVYLDRTAEWTGATWSNVITPLNPGRLIGPAMDASPSEGIILFGGFDVSLNSPVDSTWFFDAVANSWAEIYASSAPTARTHARAVYSPAHSGVVLFGGDDDDIALDDTWMYQAGSWQEVSDAVRPPRRQELALAADSARGTVVLYGGRGLSGSGLSDTWILTGNVWTQVPASGPGARLAHAMAFDPIRSVTILAGGTDRLDDSEQTWEFDGSNWSPVTCHYSPDMRRVAPAMVWDPARQVAILAGGSARGQDSTYSDTWAYGADDDGDLRVGGYDNCPQVANPNQANADLDARGDVCDCAPSDAGSWAVPVEVQALALSGSGVTTVAWGDQSATVGGGVRYDVIAGGLAALRSTGSFAGATCLGSQLAVATTSDGSTPVAGDGFYYLVRARNVCGVATYGRAALDAASPCP